MQAWSVPGAIPPRSWQDTASFIDHRRMMFEEGA
jgi:hypothetical protein